MICRGNRGSDIVSVGLSLVRGCLCGGVICVCTRQVISLFCLLIVPSSVLLS